MSTHRPDATVIIVSFNTREVLRTCLNSLHDNMEGVEAEVIVVDNASRDGSADMVTVDFPQVRLVRSDTNLGFAAANNVGFGMAQGRYIVLLNPDAVLEPGGLARAVHHMDENPRVGLAGARLLGRDGGQEPSARAFPSLLNEFLVITGLAARFPRSRLFGRFDRTWADPTLPAQVDWVPGAFAILRRQVLDEVGAFDERFFLYYEEVDLCRRIRQAGWDIWYWPDIVVHHLGGESSKTVEHLQISSSGSQLILWRMRSALLYYRKHHGLITAGLAAGLESTWHALRGLKAGHDRKPAKQAESRTVVRLMRQAWQETLGGRVSPPRPW